MEAIYIKNRLLQLESESYQICIVKGFSVETILAMRNSFAVLDQEIYEGNKINVSSINVFSLMKRILDHIGRLGLISYEAFIMLSSNFRNLSVLNKKMVVLNNNLLSVYENPTNLSVPDYEESGFQDIHSTGIYDILFSSCQHYKGKEYIQYNDPIFEEPSEVKIVNFIEGMSIDWEDEVANEEKFDIFGVDGLDEILEKIYHDENIDVSSCCVPFADKNDTRLKILKGVSRMFGKEVKFYMSVPKSNVVVRKELFDVLNNVWGYNSFRDITIYDNPDQSKASHKVSQGEIIETVVQQAEKAMNSPKEMKNILLTAPTGAGKSLLFQLAAIYLAEKYKLLTIVISPLVALMEDQVHNLVGKYEGVATINGSKTPSQKEQTINDVRDGKVNILYLAPELLLSYNINTFIGDRQIGLMVVDEAHTVTTWGRDFRVDYWFLGGYLKQVKKMFKEQKRPVFPIFALTATAVYDSNRSYNDMVYDTIDSMYMAPCIQYLGSVRRDDIVFDVQAHEINDNYNARRKAMTIDFIKGAIKEGKKAIVYFPFKATINNLVSDQRLVNESNHIAIFHGDLPAQDKSANAEEFRTGRKTIMCATKAYGMGVDVKDIEIVYHHAPTGCLSDYVQEIGRAARDPEIQGMAKIDFSSQDFRFINNLHGLSAIKTSQLRAVLKKLMELYNMKGEKRNMIVTAEDFKYIFNTTRDAEYDTKLKSCLMLISSDLYKKFGYEVLFVRPKSLFSKIYISVLPNEVCSFRVEYGNYLVQADRTLDNYFILNAEKLWNDRFVNMTFGHFKWSLGTENLLGDYHIEVVNRVEISLNKDRGLVKEDIESFFNKANIILDYIANNGTLLVQDLKSTFCTNYSQQHFEYFWETFKMLYVAHDSYCKMEYDNGEERSVRLINNAYVAVANSCLTAYDRNIEGLRNLSFCNNNSPLIRLAEVLNSLNLASYERKGGDNPSIFVRINNPFFLKDQVRTGNYNNKILNSIYEKFEYSKRLFSHFFCSNMDDKERWDFIEAYFLGEKEENLMLYGNNV